MESDAFTLELRKNQTMPSLTFATYRPGPGGDAYNATNGIRTIRNQRRRRLLGIFQRDQPTWTLALIQLSAGHAVGARSSPGPDFVPAARSAAEGDRADRSTDVTNAGLAVQNSYKQLLAARKSREAAERNAEAEQVRFENGMSNNYNVALALNDLTTRRQSELNAIITYINAIADYEKKQHVGGGAQQ